MSGSDDTYDYRMTICHGTIAQYNKDTNNYVANIGTFQGDQPRWAMIDPSAPRRGVMYTFTNGDLCWIRGLQTMRTAHIYFRCDVPSKDPDRFFVHEDTETCTFTIQVDGMGCPVSGPGAGLSGAWVFNLCVLLGAVCYLAGGYLYNSKRHGLSGCEALPHRDLWRELPGLVKDGCIYSWETAKRLPDAQCVSQLKDRCGALMSRIREWRGADTDRRPLAAVANEDEDDEIEDNASKQERDALAGIAASIAYR